jgi:hypothetical protein
MVGRIGTANRANFAVFERKENACFDDGCKPILIRPIVLLKQTESGLQRVDLGHSVLSGFKLGAKLSTLPCQLTVVGFGLFLNQKAYSQLVIDR